MAAKDVINRAKNKHRGVLPGDKVVTRSKSKKPISAGMTGRPGPKDLNHGRDERFIGWAKAHPVEACKQAQKLFDETGDSWQLDLVRKHKIGQYVDRRSAPAKTERVSTAKPVTKRRSAVSEAKLAELRTDVGAAETKLQLAKFNLNMAKGNVPVNGRRLPVAVALKRVTDAQTALDKARKALASAEQSTAS